MYFINVIAEGNYFEADNENIDNKDITFERNKNCMNFLIFMSMATADPQRWKSVKARSNLY